MKPALRYGSSDRSPYPGRASIAMESQPCYETRASQLTSLPSNRTGLVLSNQPKSHQSVLLASSKKRAGIREVGKSSLDIHAMCLSPCRWSYDRAAVSNIKV